MNKYVTLFFFSAITAVVLTSLSGGAPEGNTGSISDGQTCANPSCHGGSTLESNSSLTSDVPSSGYVPGQTYNLTATVFETGTGKFGFEVSPQDSSGSLLGTLIAGTNNRLTTSNKYLTHDGAALVSDTASWSFSWTAPAAGTGDVTFYAAFIAADQMGGNSGDQCYKTSLVLSEDATAVGVLATQSAENEVSLFPNPASDFIVLSVSNVVTDNASITIHDIRGSLVSTLESNWNARGEFSKRYDVSALPQGLYFIKIGNNQNQSVKRLFIQ